MPNTKTQELLDSVTASIKKLAEATDRTTRSEGFRRWLKATSRFHNYSFSNQMLIAFQRSDAERVAGFQTWKSLGRHVKKGAKGIAILAPIVRKLEDEEDSAEVKNKRRIGGFRTAYVFDIEDTEGEPLAELGNHRATAGGENLLPVLEAAAKELGVRLRYDTVPGGANGYSTGGEIVVEQSLTPTEKCGTIAHELAHEIVHFGYDREQACKRTKEQRELEAEATSFAVLDHFGIEQPSGIYLASWEATTETLTASLTTIRNAVHAILSAAEKAAKTEQPDYAIAA